MTTSDLQLHSYTLTLPQGSVWDTKRAYQFVEQLLFAFERLTFRIVATPQRIAWQVVDIAGRDPSAMERAIRASYPEAQISVAPLGADEFASTPVYRYVIKYQQFAIFPAPMKEVTDLAGPDPLAAISQAMSALQAGECIRYTLIVVGHAEYACKEGDRLITANERDGSLWSLAFPTKVPRFVPEVQRVLDAKLSQRLYQALLFIQLDTPDPQRFQSLLTLDNNHIVTFDRPQFNGLRAIDDGVSPTYVDNDKTDLATSVFGIHDAFVNQEKTKAVATLQQQTRLILTAGEIASLWHLPHQGCSAPTIAWAKAQVRLPATMVGQREGIYLGLNEHAGNVEPACLPLPDRSGHISIIGKAGVGKSTLMHQLIYQDIRANRGVAVLDPHGTLVCDILRTSIPDDRMQDVVVLDLANEDYPPPLNPLRVPTGAEYGLAAGQVMAVVQKFYSGFEGRMADTLWAALITLLADEMPTVRDVPRLFRDRAYRTRLVACLDNLLAEDFWADFEAQSDAQQEQLSYPVNQRMRAFYGSKALYPILCHPDGLDLDRLIAQNKIVLVSLKTDEARIPEREQRLIGATLLAHLHLAIMRRAAGSTPYYLYVDEVQHFVTTSIGELFTNARKFGLSLTVANQYLKQLAGDTLDALMGNIGAQIVFQCGLEDARALAPYMAPGFQADDLINFDKYEAAVKLRFHDATQPAFSLQTFPPLTPKEDEKSAIQREQDIRRLSITQYTPKSRADVLDWLNQRYAKQTVSDTRVRDFDEL
jgi:hypothetical protein